MMDFEDDMTDVIAEAIATVSAWDLDPEDVIQAVNDQARLLSLDYAPIQPNTNPYLELQF